jgi:hypothetical protein
MHVEGDRCLQRGHRESAQSNVRVGFGGRLLQQPRSATLSERLKTGIARPMSELEIAIISAVISLGGALASAYFSYRGLRDARLNQFLQTVAVRDQYFARLRSWADEALGLLAEAVHSCDLDPKKMPSGQFFMKRHDLRVRLSAVVDRGRWFFPNVRIDEHGSHKEESFSRISARRPQQRRSTPLT